MKSIFITGLLIERHLILDGSPLAGDKSNSPPLAAE
jgi:hypothetical protein